jgi:hypothetical protein
VFGVNVALVAFDYNQLAVTRDVNAPHTVEPVKQMLVESPYDDMIGPFKASGPNVVQIKTRTATYIHFELMPLMIGKDLTG